MKRSEKIVYGLMALVLLCCVSSVFLFDPRVKKALGGMSSPLPPDEPSHRVHAFVPDAGTH